MTANQVAASHVTASRVTSHVTAKVFSVIWVTWAALAGACTNAPRYLAPVEVLEVGIPGGDPDMNNNEVTTQLLLPIRLETEEEAAQRATEAEALGVDIPFVRADALSISIEWTLENLADEDGTAFFHVNGGNEQFFYVPLNFVINPDDDEEPPPLLGDTPIPVPAASKVSGVFREDQLHEAAVDLELITRGGRHPFAALFDYHSDLVEFPGAGEVAIPDTAFAHLVQYDIRFRANRHMRLEYGIRIRDDQGLLHELLLDAPVEELTAFAPMEYTPPPMEAVNVAQP